MHLLSRRAALAGLIVPAVAPAAMAEGALPGGKDRASILAMAGNHRVRFDMRETTPFVAGYKPIAPYTSGGFEIIRVIEDSAARISIQHILVADMGGDEILITKHWRQDWVFEPREVLTYQASGKWALTPVSAADRRGAWAQTVWQTDDSPRYGGVGRWVYDNGVPRWESGVTRRPLARRDAVRKPVYGWYEGINRHALTPNGWVHEQDNAKTGLIDGREQTFVHEVATNTYERFEGFPVKAGDDYWAATGAYWAAVRSAWDEAIRKGRGVAVAEEPEMGSVTGERLMTLADEITEKKTAVAAAAAKAREVIAGATA